jgi:hypothetical protein
MPHCDVAGLASCKIQSQASLEFNFDAATEFPGNSFSPKIYFRKKRPEQITVQAAYSLTEAGNRPTVFFLNGYHLRILNI